MRQAIADAGMLQRPALLLLLRRQGGWDDIEEERGDAYVGEMCGDLASHHTGSQHCRSPDMSFHGAGLLRLLLCSLTVYGIDVGR